MSHAKILDFEELRQLRDRLPRKRIVHCHGVFDVLHAGHLSYFRSAKAKGDCLVVTITADEFVNKGPGRPYFNSVVRSQMLAALEIVDYVAISKFPTAVNCIEALRPHFYVKGPDYRVKEKDVSGGILIEEQAVQRVGGQLVFTDDEMHSSSELINKFFTQWTAEQLKAIEQVKKLGGYPAIEEIFERVSKQKVTVIGEPIIDTYVFCSPEAISSKSPSISAKFGFEENYGGGALAIANNTADFVKELTLLTTFGDESYIAPILEARMDPRVNLVSQKLPGVPTPRKTRFISIDRSQRIFEITDLRSDQWDFHSPREFCETVRKHDSPERMAIVADFGHGLFEGEALETVNRLRGFVGLNVQTNSSNLGFNPFTKHKRFSFLSIDTKEARVAYHDRRTAPLELARRIRADLGPLGAAVAMTMGPNGAVFFPQKPGSEVLSPAFSDTVIDATGAGDAFFLMASLLIKVDCPDPLVPFISNVFAGLKTRIVGHQATVSKAQLLKACVSILK